MGAFAHREIRICNKLSVLVSPTRAAPGSGKTASASDGDSARFAGGAIWRLRNRRARRTPRSLFTRVRKADVPLLQFREPGLYRLTDLQLSGVEIGPQLLFGALHISALLRCFGDR